MPLYRKRIGERHWGPNSVPETPNVKLRGMDSNLPRSGREFGILWENHKFSSKKWIEVDMSRQCHLTMNFVHGFWTPHQDHFITPSGRAHTCHHFGPERFELCKLNDLTRNASCQIYLKTSVKTRSLHSAVLLLWSSNSRGLLASSTTSTLKVDQLIQ